MQKNATASRSGAPRNDPPDPLTFSELLTGWLSSARELHEPDTLGDCGEYSRHLEAVYRARMDADALCERLGARLADWIDGEVQNQARPQNRLTPPG